MSQNRRSELFDKLHKLPLSRSGDRAPRVAVKIRVQVQVKGRMGTIEATSVNISRSGILLSIPVTSKNAFSVGDTVELLLDLDCQFFSEKIAATSKVVRHVEPNDGSKNAGWIAIAFCYE